MRFGYGVGYGAALAMTLVLVAGNAVGQTAPPARSRNPVNDELVKLSPGERAARLARAVGNWCIGTETFLMGVLASDPGAGNAYWSLRCADGSTWAVQLDPAAEVTAIDCDVFKASAAGKECFKKF